MTTSTFLVSSMTCAHCVAAVTEEIARLDGVQDVAVDLVPGGQSAVTVTSATPLLTPPCVRPWTRPATRSPEAPHDR